MSNNGTEGEKCPLDTNYVVADLCKFVNRQTLKLQEAPEDVPTGEMPRHIVCVVERSLVDRIAPGTRCSILGYIDTFDQAKQVATSPVAHVQRMVDTVALKVSYIRVLGVQVEETGVGRAISTFTPSEEEQFLALARSSGVYDRIVRNIAPSLSGDYTLGSVFSPPSTQTSRRPSPVSSSRAPARCCPTTHASAATSTCC